VRYMGKDIAGVPPEDVARAGIGFVPQGRRLFPALTVAQNLEMGRLKRTGGAGVRWSEERVFAMFPRLAQRLNAKADTLSGGEQQMVAIARDRVQLAHVSFAAADVFSWDPVSGDARCGDGWGFLRR